MARRNPVDRHHSRMAPGRPRGCGEIGASDRLEFITVGGDYPARATGGPDAATSTSTPSSDSRVAAEKYGGASQMASSTALVMYVSPGCGASVRSCAKGLPGAADPKLLSSHAPIAARRGNRCGLRACRGGIVSVLGRAGRERRGSIPTTAADGDIARSALGTAAHPSTGGVATGPVDPEETDAVEAPKALSGERRRPRRRPVPRRPPPPAVWRSRATTTGR